jgi:hypothetical protein
MTTDLAFNFQGEWDAATNTPDLSALSLNDTTDRGKYWVASSAVSTLVAYAIGDGISWGGPAQGWQKVSFVDLFANTLDAEDDVSITEITGNSPGSTANTLNTDTCYTDFSVFKQAGVLKQVQILTPTAGDFYIIHFRKTLTNKWLEIARYKLTSLTSSNTVYNKIDVSTLNISVLPQDCFGYVKASDTPGNPLATMRYNENASIAKATKIVTLDSGTGKYTFTQSNFPTLPAASSGTAVRGRELAISFVLEGNVVKKNTTDIALLQSGYFAVPADFNWSDSVLVDRLANICCIISHEHIITADINLPKGIILKFVNSGKFKGLNKIPTLDFNSTDWTTSGDAAKDPANGKKFTTTTNGSLNHSSVLQTGQVLSIRIRGSSTVTGGNILVLNSSKTFIDKPIVAGVFDTIYDSLLYDGADAAITIKITSTGAGTTTIDTFEIIQPGGYLNSYADYGVVDETVYPLLEYVKGHPPIEGAYLKGMFKIAGNELYMSDYFPGESYRATFYDSFVKTKFVIDKNLTQKGNTYNSINVAINDENYKYYKGLSVGCGIEGIDGVTVNNLYLFATGDFYLKNLSVNTGHINICNFDIKHPLKITIAAVNFLNVSMNNIQPHMHHDPPYYPPVISLILIADIRNSNFVMDTHDTLNREVFRFMSVTDTCISNCKFHYKGYVTSGSSRDSGQPIVLQSSVNSVYENNIMDNGDSGLLFFFDIHNNITGYPAWIESHAMDFTGFENNIVRGNIMSNMVEEGFSCDPTFTDFATVTMNRNYFKILELDPSSGTKDYSFAKIKLQYTAGGIGDKNYKTFVNTIMTSITEGKFGNYCKIVAVEPVIGNTDFTEFRVTGSSNFFENAAVNDYYSLTYAYYNNVIDNNRFVNCSQPIAFALFAFRNIIRNNIISGRYNKETASADSGQLSYSAQTNRCYTCPCIDNVYENNLFDNNGLRLISATTKEEALLDWLNDNPINPPIANISKESDLNTIVRGNTFKNTIAKYQSLSGLIYENNKTINTPVTFTDTTFYSDTYTLVNESENIGIDNLFAAVDAQGSMLIPITSNGNGSGYMTLKIGVVGDTTVRITGNGYLYDNTSGSNPNRIKIFTGISGDINLYIKCLNGDSNVIISNALNITHLGNTDNLFEKSNTTNSPDIYLLKATYLPKNITSIKQNKDVVDSGINVRGNVANLPRGLQQLYIRTYNLDMKSLLDGYIIDFPRTLTFIYLSYYFVWGDIVAFRGDLATDLPADCTYFYDNTKTGFYTYSTTREWAEDMRRVFIRLRRNNMWTSDMINQLIIDLSNTTWAEDPNTIDIGGNGVALPFTRTPACDTAVTDLHTIGVEVFVNGVNQYSDLTT